jgi:hypothetical protein
VARARPRHIATAAALLAFALACACRGAPGNDVPDAGVSPQAKAEPAQLENVVAVASSAQPLTADAGPPPVPLRPDEAASLDALAKDTVGWEMEATLRTLDVPPAFRGPETAIGAIDAAKKKTDARLTLDFTQLRARIVLAGTGFVLPEDTELRARSDRYGYFLLFPSAREYRIAAPGSLRALFGERRIDVEPLIVASVLERGEGARRLGVRTRRVEVTNRVATATFEIARVPEVGEGGVLICRALLDLMNAPPQTSVCALDDVPLHVEWKWGTKGGLVFEGSTFPVRVDLSASSISAPPVTASFAQPSLPDVGAEALIEPAELAAFRSAPADPPSTPDASAPAGPSGLALANGTDETRLAWLDGAPVAWVAPGRRISLPSLLRGRYGFAWRTFLGDSYDAPITITVPATMTAGAADAGAP